MEPKLQRRVQRYGWDRAAGSYATFWGDQLRPAHEAAIRLSDPQVGEQVVDVACGGGEITFDTADRVGVEGHVLGLDISEKMVAVAQADAVARGSSNTSFRRSDAESLACVDASFDLALCSLGLMYVPEPAVAVAEMRRVLRPSGRIAVSVWGQRRHCGWAELFPIVDRRVKSDVCPMFFFLGAPGALEATLENAGFIDVSVTRLRVDLAYSDESQALGAAFLGGPVSLPYGRFGDDERRDVEREYLDSIEEFRNGEGYLLPGEFVTDRFLNTSSIGALAVAPSDGNVLYAGTGETTIRLDITHGDGVYKSTRTWVERACGAPPSSEHRMSIRVIIADDQDIVRAGLVTILDGQADIEIVGQAANGRDAVAMARRLRPDVCLFDIRMPELDGIEATRQLAGADVDDPIPVAVITTSTPTATSTER
jgi:ubiquinone/menaquinone biosynthesis C-methylase UbiE/CheY-like chemotaxis protein